MPPGRAAALDVDDYRRAGRRTNEIPSLFRLMPGEEEGSSRGHRPETRPAPC